ncbi:hypothetical protein IGL98_003217 [Enterococcus sp. DIV0840]|uniref:DUF1049 domain-containing protein n=1 Tax=Enterococcus TaxID=1350 RepID=UPI001A8EAB3C|nr:MULTISPECIES: DUF1049 domain-containing protein [Enterococcus]MBO0436142.1 DUF1049 domain-containing protein [Enterococcus sp. DIV0849a]MBO0475287.1 DUF1049 domain-containing protein [Enterococcus ureasiticus]
MDNIKKIVTPKRVIALIVVILIMLFAFQNFQNVELSLIFISVEIPLLILILSLYILGIITGWAIKRNDVKKIVNDV